MSEFESIKTLLDKISNELGSANKFANEAHEQVWKVRDEVAQLERKVSKCRSTISVVPPAAAPTK